MLITILGAILTIFFIILFHECGHFFAAKMCGVKVLRFSIGFGKSICLFRDRSGTEYVLGILPLGGYVKMLDDKETSVSGEALKSSYNRQRLPIRMFIVIAGPLANFLLAFLILWIVYLQGISYVRPVIGQVTPDSMAAQANLKPDDLIVKVDEQYVDNWQDVLSALIKRVGSQDKVIIITHPLKREELEMHNLSLVNWKLTSPKTDFFKDLGFQPYQPKFPAIIVKVLSNSPAAQSELQSGDEIMSLNGQTVTNWLDFVKEIQRLPHEKVQLLVKRNKRPYRVDLQIGDKKIRGHAVGYLGVEARVPQWPKELMLKRHYSFGEASGKAFQQVQRLIEFNLTVLEKIIRGKISINLLGGPITIFEGAGEASQQGLGVYLSFVAFISVSLGFINILPIPGLDGGYLLFHFIEAIFRRPIPDSYQVLFWRIGIFLVIFLIVQATINDMVRLFNF